MYSGLLHDRQHFTLSIFFFYQHLSFTHIDANTHHKKSCIQATGVYDFILYDAENSLKAGKDRVRRGNGVVVFIYKKGRNPFCSCMFWIHSLKKAQCQSKWWIMWLEQNVLTHELRHLISSSGPRERFWVVRNHPTPLAAARASYPQWSTAPAVATSETWP